MVRLIDADVLEKEGWSLHRTVRVDRHTSEYQTKPIAKVPTIEPEPHWIPCSERLPDNDDSVLISNSHGVTKAWWNGRFWTSIAVKKYKTVTAWMPLPEPYEERRER